MSVTDTHSARRVIRKLVERETAFLALSGPARRSVGPLLDELAPTVERVYLVGPLPGGAGVGGLRRWAAPPLPAGWVEHGRGHYLEGDHPALRFTAPDGRMVEVLRAAAYFGEGDYSAADAAAAWVMLGDELRRDFPRLNLLSSPSATGREAVLQALPRGRDFPTLPDELQQLIRSTSGQGRIEVVAGRAPRVRELVEYDGRLMYAALCWGLPSGGGMHVRATEYLGQRRARYFGRVRVPSDWSSSCTCGAPGHAGIGLLPYADESGGWSYPSEPGRVFAGWWDGAELHVALAHGWGFAPQTAIVFDSESSGPLDAWAKRLVSVRGRLALHARGGERARIATMAHDAVRAIILHSIGALHGSAHRVTRSVPIEEADRVPADARDLRVEHDSLVWAEYGGAGWPELSHPEWSSAIWARARARLLSGPLGTGALHVPAAHVIAFRTDALYLGRDPDWPDDGAAGRFRRVHKWGARRTPRSHAELVALAR